MGSRETVVMRKVAMILLMTFVAQVHPRWLAESQALHAVSPPFMIQEEDMRDPQIEMVDKLAENLVDRAFKVMPFHYTELKDTTLAKPEETQQAVTISSTKSKTTGDRTPRTPRGRAVFKSPYRPEVEVDLESGPRPPFLVKLARCASGHFVSGQLDQISLAIRSSLLVNFVLLIVKAYAFFLSRSLAVLASLVDSTIDLLGQGVLMWTQRIVSSKHQNTEDYPAGRARLEPIGVMVCAVVMGMASIEVISTSVHKLLKFWHEGAAAIQLSLSTTVTLLSIVVLKLALYFYCSLVAKRSDNESVRAIAQDNQNDVLSNLAALLGAWMTHIGPKWWVVDPLAGTVISLYIIFTWLRTGFEQVELIVGKKADPEFLKKIQDLVQNQQMRLDSISAYHFGPKYLVEVEVVMPEHTTLRESHDAGIVLQHNVESLEEVERCFVHIDYQYREHDDHDPGVPLKLKMYNAPQPRNPRKALTDSTSASLTVPTLPVSAPA